MARGHGDADGIGSAAERPSDMRQNLTLPGLGSAIPFQHRPRLAPWKGEQHEAQRVVRIGPDLDAQGIQHEGPGGIKRVGHDVET